MAKAYGVDGIRIASAAEFKPALERAIKSNSPYVIDVSMQKRAGADLRALEHHGYLLTGQEGAPRQHGHVSRV
jgi:thiamine pyrophosphate-dependent acetolactate synthase large subunit-like protein